MKNKIRRTFERTTGFTVCKNVPQGEMPYNDLRVHFKSRPFNLFFDIGANVGQSIAGIRKYFPHATIWAFEPVPRTYQTLLAHVPDAGVKCFQIGFGAEQSVLDIFVDSGISGSDRISLNTEIKSKDTTQQKETVTIETLNLFCPAHNIEKIDYVKIDTEGYDLNVLKGATQLLEKNKIDFIETEVGMNPDNDFHVRFEDIKQYLKNFD